MKIPHKNQKKMKLKVFLVIVLLLCLHRIYSQNTSIHFLSEESSHVIMYKPIDNAYNNFYPTDTIILNANLQSTCSVDTDDWAIVKCFIPGKAAFNIFIEKGDSVNVINTNSDIIFTGKNAAGNELDLYAEDVSIANLVDSILTTKNKMQIEQMIDNPGSVLQRTGVISRLKSMHLNKEISLSCYYYLYKRMYYKIHSQLLNIFRSLLKNDPQNDSIRYYGNKAILNVFMDDHIMKNDIGDLCATSYYALYYQLNETEKKDLIEGDKTFLGPYSYAGLMLDNIRLPFLFGAFILQYQYGVYEFDREIMYKYLEEKYPQSESLQIIKRFRNEELRDAIPTKITYIDSESVRKLSDFQKLSLFKNKYVFIDIWASWCIPCRIEFSHNKELDVLLSRYPNLEKLYISIDESKDNWEKAIATLRLSGYHLQASSELLEFLKRDVYPSGRIFVPKYILLAPNGEIINTDMPRPSSIDDLKAEFDKLINDKTK